MTGQGRRTRHSGNYARVKKPRLMSLRIASGNRRVLSWFREDSAASRNQEADRSSAFMWGVCSTWPPCGRLPLFSQPWQTTRSPLRGKKREPKPLPSARRYICKGPELFGNALFSNSSGRESGPSYAERDDIADKSEPRRLWDWKNWFSRRIRSSPGEGCALSFHPGEKAGWLSPVLNLDIFVGRRVGEEKERKKGDQGCSAVLAQYH